MSWMSYLRVSSQSAGAYRISLVYKSTFYDQKTAQKITLDFYTSHTQRPDPRNPINQHNNCLKSVRNTEFIKPVLIVCELCHFSAHSSSTKKFEIINFKWLNTELLELISIVSADCRTDIDSNNPTMNQCRHFIVFYYQSINYLSNYLAVTLLFD